MRGFAWKQRKLFPLRTPNNNNKRGLFRCSSSQSSSCVLTRLTVKPEATQRSRGSEWKIAKKTNKRVRCEEYKNAVCAKSHIMLTRPPPPSFSCATHGWSFSVHLCIKNPTSTLLNSHTVNFDRLQQQSSTIYRRKVTPPPPPVSSEWLEKCSTSARKKLKFSTK